MTIRDTALAISGDEREVNDAAFRFLIIIWRGTTIKYLGNR